MFERLVLRNALNASAGHFAAAIATPGDLPHLRGWVDGCLERLLASSPPRPAREPLDLSAGPLPAIPPRRATLLVGSPRGRASTSMTLALHLGGALAARGVDVSTMDLHRESMADPGLARVLAALGDSDTVALFSPLYADSLPAPVTRSLEVLAPALARAEHRIRFLAVVNSGFSETVHSETALAISRCFAAAAGLEWIGGLGIGAGPMITLGAREGARLTELPLRSRLTRALDLTADAISRGEVIPPTAQELLRRPLFPRWLYRRLSEWHFWSEARRHGVHLDGSRRVASGA